jgi:hypothetical protein
MCGFIPSLSYTFENMKCDSRASFLTRTFTSPCFGHKPKVRIITIFNKKKEFRILIFFSFFKKNEFFFDNLFSLMLDPKFKTFHHATSFIYHEQKKAIVEKYDKKNCFLCFLNVTNICIFWLNLKKVLLIKGLKSTAILISLK